MEKERSSLCFISKGRVVNVPYASITHISKQGIDTLIYTEVLVYKTHQSLQELLQELPYLQFFRVHRSHIISLEHMRGMQRQRILVGTQRIPFSNYYKKRMLRTITEQLDHHIEFHHRLLNTNP